MPEAGGGYVKIIPRGNDLFYFDRQVIFTDLYIDNECVNANRPAHNGRIILTKNIQLLNNLNLNYSDNSFAVEVSAMDYGNLHKLQYEYRLNKNEEWTKLEGNRIYFNKLAPGTYQLQVRDNEIMIMKRCKCYTFHQCVSANSGFLI